MADSFWSHIGELQSRLVKIVIAVGAATGLAFWGADYLLAWLLKPSPLTGQVLIALKPQEVLLQSFRLSLLGGLILVSPLVLYQIWAFVRPGLLPKERRFVWIALTGGAGLFLAGLLFAYFVVIPAALRFFVVYSQHFGIQPTWTMEYYLQFILMFLLSFGLAFELPLLLIALVWLRLISAESLAAKRPYIIVALAVIAAILTPPDVVSQILLLIPLWLLFEGSLFISRRL